MNTFAILLVCIQTFLVQNVLSQCNYGADVIQNSGIRYSSGLAEISGCGGSLGSSLGYGLGGAGLLGNSGVVGYGATEAAAYGGAGEGNVAVAGELPVAGNTAVIGTVPILGAVNFAGNLPASGCVSINGQCSCGCGY